MYCIITRWQIQRVSNATQQNAWLVLWLVRRFLSLAFMPWADWAPDDCLSLSPPGWCKMCPVGLCRTPAGGSTYHSTIASNKPNCTHQITLGVTAHYSERHYTFNKALQFWGPKFGELVAKATVRFRVVTTLTQYKPSAWAACKCLSSSKVDNRHFRVIMSTNYDPLACTAVN